MSFFVCLFGFSFSSSSKNASTSCSFQDIDLSFEERPFI